MLTIDKVAVEPGVEFHLAGVFSFGRGLFHRDPLRAEDTSYKHMNRLHPGRLVMSKLKAWEGAISLIGTEFDGAVLSPEFPTYAINRDLLNADYLHLLTTHPAFWRQLATKSTGMGGRKERVHQSRVLEIELDIPPLQEQGRIIGVMQAFEDALAAAESTHAAHRALDRQLVSDWVAKWTGPIASVGDLATMRSGPSWKAADELSTPEAGSRQVLGITNTPANGELTMTERRYVRGLPSTTRALAKSSLLMVRTNGSRARIGNVYRVPSEAVGLAFSAFQIGLDFDSPEHAAFAYWMLSERGLQERMSAAASGTTGLGNIAQRWLKQVEIPWPERQGDRAQVVEVLDTAGAATQKAAALLDAMRTAREAVRGELLSGNHPIPDSYDELPDRAS